MLLSYGCKINKFGHEPNKKALNILLFNGIVLPLQPQINDGGIAQLVRAHDS